MAYFFPETENLITPSTLQILSKSLIIERTIFRQQLIALSLLSLFIGYQVADIGITFFKQFKNINGKKKVVVSEKCPLCKSKPFSFVNPTCKHIVCCQECRENAGDICGRCGTALEDEMIKLYI